ncbi:hypothetical protein LJR220_006289 [Bradyrhizobium sp. LjRoot220]|uniref:DUF6869 domain-containing protein n=1 Tax=Bradyrhizobium sp. LjRoot220 TaxID=3342284 RepID=UPI003ECF4923
MKPTDDAAALAPIAALPEQGSPDETARLLDAMPVNELASTWAALQRLSRRDQTSGIWEAIMYFDRLPHDNPNRALDLALEVLRSESDKPTVMQLNGKFMMSLTYAHGADIIDRIESEARDNARLRWLLGGILFGPDKLFKQRILAIADPEAWKADEIARRTPKQPLDCAAMSVQELARAWVEQHSKSDRDRDDNFFAMMDYEGELRGENPDKAIDLIVAILAIETNPALLSLLSAGPLEDVISMETIDRIEREAQANKRFHDLLGGVWYYRASDELKARLDALVGQVSR